MIVQIYCVNRVAVNPKSWVVAKKIGAQNKRETGNLREALGALLTDLRIKKGWSIRELSHRINYTHNTVQAVELGRTNPTLSTIEVFARAYSMKVSALLRGAERRIKPSASFRK